MRSCRRPWRGSGRVAAALVVALALGVALTACDDSTSTTHGPSTAPTITPSGASGPTQPSATTTPTTGGPPPVADLDVPGGWRAAISTPVRDSLYPQAGDAGVDALHYDLTLAWQPVTKILTGTERLAFRRLAAPARLMLSPALRIGSLSVDGRPASYTRDGFLLSFAVPAGASDVHTLNLTYTGTPRDLPDTGGFRYLKDGQALTLHAPHGAATWYAVDDTPSDKAFYDFTLSVPAPMVGVANGALVQRRTHGGITTTEFHLDAPAASYLAMVTFDRYTRTDAGVVAGVRLTYWTPTRPVVVRDFQGRPVRGLTPLTSVRAAAGALRWLVQKLGPYPFSTLAIVTERNNLSAIETETTISLGISAYTLQPDNILHEIAHQWYGDEVTPTDWSDLWMNEGMAYYLQYVWRSDHGGDPMATTVAQWTKDEPAERRRDGPPAHYDPATFAPYEVYIGPALMWDAIRQRVGDDTFWRLVREWPSVDRFGNATRKQYVAWLDAQAGQDLSGLVDDWLDSPTSPVA